MKLRKYLPNNIIFNTQVCFFEKLEKYIDRVNFRSYGIIMSFLAAYLFFATDHFERFIIQLSR